MWALMDKCSLCLFLRIRWSAQAFHGMHDRSILLATGRWCALSPSATPLAMSTPAARAAWRCGTSVIQETRPLYPSWTALWVYCNDPDKHDTAMLNDSNKALLCTCPIRTEITTSAPVGFFRMDGLSLSGARRVLCPSGIWLRQLHESRLNWLRQHLHVMLWPSAPTPRSAFPAALMET